MRCSLIYLLLGHILLAVYNSTRRSVVYWIYGDLDLALYNVMIYSTGVSSFAFGDASSHLS